MCLRRDDNDPDIVAWHRLGDRLTTSGQPEAPQLAALGVRMIVNLALHDHKKALPDEAGSVAALGLDYIHIPVAWDAPCEDDYARFREAMNSLSGSTVHVHCIANFARLRLPLPVPSRRPEPARAASPRRIGTPLATRRRMGHLHRHLRRRRAPSPLSG